MSSRSPNSGQTTSGSGSGSTPDLRTLGNYNFTLRKRKYECDCADLLVEFRKDIMSFFQEFTNTQQENTLKLHQEIQDLKSEIKNNNALLESTIAEQNHLTVELDGMKSLTGTIQQKVTSLENDICQLKSNCSNEVSLQHSLSYEDTIFEIQERSRRNKNIILIGLPEPKNSDRDSRRNCDKNEAIEIIKKILPECPMPHTVLRLGKYNPNKNRSIKLCFENQETAKLILKNKKKLASNTIRLYPDLTPKQQYHMNHLRNELASREQKGETDLIIKYIKGIPKIIKSSAKNETRLMSTSKT